MNSQETKSAKATIGGSKRKSEFHAATKQKRQKVKDITLSDQYLRPLEHGWKREVVLRCIFKESRSADVYYYTPSGKKLRSMPDVMSFLQSDSDQGQHLSRENFTFHKEVIFHHRNEWTRSASDRRLSSTKKAKQVSHRDCAPPEPKRKVGRPRRSGVRTSNKTGSKVDDVIASDVGMAARNKDVKNERTDGGKCPETKAKRIKKDVLSEPPVLFPVSDLIDPSPTLDHSPPTLSIIATPSPSPSDPQIACSLNCPKLAGVRPTLECELCLCLFHPECIGLIGSQEVRNFVCQTCKVFKFDTKASELSDKSSDKFSLDKTQDRGFSSFLMSLGQKHITSSKSLQQYSTSTALAVHQFSKGPLQCHGDQVRSDSECSGNVLDISLPGSTNNPPDTSPVKVKSVLPCSTIPHPNCMYPCLDPLSVLQNSVIAQNWNIGTSCPSGRGTFFQGFYMQNCSTYPVLDQTWNCHALTRFYQAITLNTKAATGATHTPLVMDTLFGNRPRLLPGGVINDTIPAFSSNLLKRLQQEKNKRRLVFLSNGTKTLNETSISIKDISRNSDESNVTSSKKSISGDASVPRPLFVHDGSFERLESTVSSNGVVSKIILPDYNNCTTHDAKAGQLSSPCECISQMAAVCKRVIITDDFSSTSSEFSSNLYNHCATGLSTFEASHQSFTSKVVDCSRVGDRTEGVTEGGCYDRSSGNASIVNVLSPETHIDDDHQREQFKSREPLSEEDFLAGGEGIVKFHKDVPRCESKSGKYCNVDDDSNSKESLDECISSTTVNIAFLSDQLLERIFQFLTTSEVLSISQVCKRWKDISRSEALWSTLRITDDLLWTLKSKVSERVIFNEAVSLWLPQLLDLRGLNLSNEDMVGGFSELLLSMSTKLVEVKDILISFCPLTCLSKIREYFPQVRCLSMQTKSDHVSSYIRILTTFRNLEKLEIWHQLDDGAHDVNKEGVKKNAHFEDDRTESERLNEDQGSERNNFATLEELKLLGFPHAASLDFVQLFLSNSFDVLHSLTVGCCQHWNEQTYALLGNLPSLTKLALRNGGSIPNPGLSLALTKMKGLLELKLSSYIVDWSVSLSIKKLHHLKKLHIHPVTNPANLDEAPYVNLCCMSAVWNLKNLQQLIWVTSPSFTTGICDGSLAFQIYDDTTKLKCNEHPDPIIGRETKSEGKLLLLSIGDLQSKLQISLPNTKVKILVQ